MGLRPRRGAVAVRRSSGVRGCARRPGPAVATRMARGPRLAPAPVDRGLVVVARASDDSGLWAVGAVLVLLGTLGPPPCWCPSAGRCARRAVRRAGAAETSSRPTRPPTSSAPRPPAGPAWTATPDPAFGVHRAPRRGLLGAPRVHRRAAVTDQSTIVAPPTGENPRSDDVEAEVSPVSGDDLARARGTDFFHVDDHLDDRERAVLDRVRTFCDDAGRPGGQRLLGARGVPVRRWCPRYAELGVAGGSLHRLRLPGPVPAGRGHGRRRARPRRRQHRHLQRRPLRAGHDRHRAARLRRAAAALAAGDGRGATGSGRSR